MFRETIIDNNIIANVKSDIKLWWQNKEEENPSNYNFHSIEIALMSPTSV